MIGPADAMQILLNCSVEIGDDFHRLAGEQIDQLLVHAERLKYRKPKNANDSRARYFHDYLQRRARSAKS